MEIWKDVVGYEGRYVVSNLGKVKSLKKTVPHSHSKTRTFPEVVLKPNKVAFDYLQVSLYKDGKRKCRYVHNLVMEAFVGEKKIGYEVNHKDEDKSNNRLENLEYLTAKENNNYGTRIERSANYGVNYLGPDAFLSSKQTRNQSNRERDFIPLTGFYLDKFNFFSPHGVFNSKYRMGREFVFETEETARVEGFFEPVFNHPKDYLITNFSLYLALIMGAIQGISYFASDRQTAIFWNPSRDNRRCFFHRGWDN